MPPSVRKDSLEMRVSWYFLQISIIVRIQGDISVPSKRPIISKCFVGNFVY